MSATVFVDTNVLVYCRDLTEGSKQELAMEWVRRLWQSGTGRVSYQVLQEYYVTVTEKLKPGLDRERARQEVRALLTWKPLRLDNGTLASAWMFQESHGVALWDALILAAADAVGCRFLLSEDFQTGRRFGNLEVINPFKTAPSDVLG